MDLHNMDKDEACQKVYSKLGDLMIDSEGTYTFITGTGPLQKQITDIIEEHDLEWEVPAGNLGVVKVIM